MDWKRCDLDDRYQRIILHGFFYRSVSWLMTSARDSARLADRVLHFSWFIVDSAGRRPILLTGAVIVSGCGPSYAYVLLLIIVQSKMAIALTATGWWIYIDQDITPKAGKKYAVEIPLASKLIACCSCDLHRYLQCCIWHVMGTYPLVVPTRGEYPSI